LSKLDPKSSKFTIGQMCDASEAFDELMTRVGKHLEKWRSTSNFRNVVGFELFKKYWCECKKQYDF